MFESDLIVLRFIFIFIFVVFFENMGVFYGFDRYGQV